MTPAAAGSLNPAIAPNLGNYRQVKPGPAPTLTSVITPAVTAVWMMWSRQTHWLLGPKNLA